MLRLVNFVAGYAGRREPVLDISDIEFGPGLNYLIGRNGSGKSTLLRALAGSAPEVVAAGEILRSGRSGKTGVVSQKASDSVFLDLSFRDNLLLATLDRWQYISLAPLRQKGRIQRVETFAEALGLKRWVLEVSSTKAWDLSSGQQQLLSILMRLMRSPDLLLLDECTANLDAENTEIVMNTLGRVASSGTVILFATHQLHLLEAYHGTAFELADRGIRELRGEVVVALDSREG